MQSPAEKPDPDCAVRLAVDTAGRDALRTYLDRQGLSQVVEYMPKDDDELNASLCEGRFRRIVFADLDAVLSMLWKNHGDLDRWLIAGVRIELAEPPEECAGAWLPALIRMHRSLTDWRRSERRRKTLSGLVLSFLALLAAALLLLAAAK
jgi:hypothetical protein